MGLDLALGGLVLLVGLRGWFKGFLLQAIRLAGVVASVYAADPVRNVVKPHVTSYLPSVHPNVVDRLLWWVTAVVCYFLLVGIASLLVKLSRRKTLGEPEPHYNDQFGGFLLGLLKGVAVVVGLVAAVQTYAIGYVKNVPWAERQAEQSRVLAWNTKYQPAARVWSSRPVQHFVNHIHRMGIQPPDSGGTAPPPVASANRPPQLTIPSQSANGSDLTQLFEAIEAEVRKLDSSR